MEEKTVERTIQTKDVSIKFSIEESDWTVRLAKSQTQVDDPRQIRMLSAAPLDSFVPMEVKVEQDAFTFSFFVDPKKKRWEKVKALHRHDKLRLLCNVAQLRNLLDSRLTFFIHPENMVFDDSLRPYLIYRGLRDSIPPFEMDEEEFLKQLKCFSIAILSTKYSFDDLYQGEWIHAKETEFQRKIGEQESLDGLIAYLEENYQKEQEKVDRTMRLLPVKRFRLFKRLSITFIIVSILLAVPLIYIAMVNLPYQENLLSAHEEFLANDHNGVISELRDEDAAELPQSSKYILSSAYLAIEPVSDSDRAIISNNISLSSDENYLLYWIYNGRGQFDAAMDRAKYLDDPQLIMYGLVKQIEKAKNNPNLSGSERDERVRDLQQELDDYREEYNLNEDESPIGTVNPENSDDGASMDDQTEDDTNEDGS